MPKKAANIVLPKLLVKVGHSTLCAEPVDPHEALALHLCQHEVAAAVYRLFEKIPDNRKDKIAGILESYLKNLLA